MAGTGARGAETGPGTGPKAGPEAGPEAGPGSRPGTGQTAGPEAGPEAGPGSRPGTGPVSGPETLDPADWEGHRAVAHRIVDDAVDYLRDLRDRPLWQAMPPAVRARFRRAVPQDGQPLEEIYGEIVRDLLPYPMGNIHPRFWMWYMGSSNFTGALGDFIAAILGSNIGGGDHAAAEIDKQVVDWLKQMMGYPAEASGTLVSGGSVANLIGLTVARNRMAGIDIRERGVGALAAPMRFYASDQVHSCHRKAMEAMGLGNAALRRIPSDADCGWTSARCAPRWPRTGPPASRPPA